MVKEKQITKSKEKKSLKDIKGTVDKNINSKSKVSKTSKVNKKVKHKYTHKKGNKEDTSIKGDGGKNNIKNKKNIQSGGSEVCSRDLNELLAGNPLVASQNISPDERSADEKMKGVFTDFKKDVSGSFSGIDKSIGGNPGLPPKLPEGCTIL